MRGIALSYEKADGTPAKSAEDPAAVYKVLAGKLRIRIDGSAPAERLVGGSWMPTGVRRADPGPAPAPPLFTSEVCESTTTTDRVPVPIRSFALPTGFGVLLDFTVRARVTSGQQINNSFAFRGNVLIENPAGVPRLTNAASPVQPVYFADETSGLLSPASVSFAFALESFSVFVAGVMMRGPVTYSPYSAVSDTEKRM